MRRILLLLVMLVFVSAASATDYYVATWGDNTTQGNITHPWQNVSYAVNQITEGDTIYLFDGTWYNEHVAIACNNTTIAAYNGTPTLDGIDKTGYGILWGGYWYCLVDGLKILNYSTCISMGGQYGTVSNCTLSDTGDVIIGTGTTGHHQTIKDCILYNSGWNTIQLSGHREPPNGDGIPATYITVRNCTIYNSTVHNAIDLFGNLQHVIIEDNELYDNPAGCIFEHDDPDHREYVTIRDNYFHDTQEDAMQIGVDSYYEIYNNTFKNITDSYPIYIYVNSHDFEIYNNSFYNCLGPRTVGGYNFTFDRNYIHTDSGAYMFSYGANGTVRNPLGKKQLEVKFYNAAADMEFDDGTLFTATFGGTSNYTPVRYYSDKSNCSITAIEYEQLTLSTTTYNITLRPTYAYLCNVTVNHESSATDDRTNISINSSVSTNPTWINATMQNASANYSISVDGSIVGYIIADSDGIVRYHYTDSWSPHDFEFNWVDQGDFSPDHTKAYYNMLSSIENTVNSTGYHFYNKTIGWDDTEITSFKLVVKTS